MKNKYLKIYLKIKKYKKIVITRHVGADPDALGSQLALRDSIRKKFPNKEVYAIGAPASTFKYLGQLDKFRDEMYDNSLLIVLDTPDKRRVDIDNLDMFKHKIKIDHHPFVEEFCDIEYIDEENSSASQIIAEFLYQTKLKKTKSIMEKLFQGIISDTNRFMFSNSGYKTFELVAKMMKDFNLNLPKLYEPLYLRPLREIKLQGYIEQNMTVTDNGVAYIKITDEIINKFKVDASAAGNMINNFNYIEEVLVWLTISEDVKNDILKISIRSRGPEINKIAEKYNGGGHKLASGARVKTMEEVEFLINDLDKACSEYIMKDEV